MSSVIPSLSFPVIIDFLMFVGLLLDFAGAALLIGPNVTVLDFRVMGWIGAKIWPNLLDAREGLIHLKGHLELTPEHEGFRPLAAVFQNHQSNLFDKAAHPEREPKKFEIHTVDGDVRVRFTFEGGTLFNEKQKRLEDILDRRIENTYRTSGAWLLLVGFTFQIIAVVLTFGRSG